MTLGFKPKYGNTVEYDHLSVVPSLWALEKAQELWFGRLNGYVIPAEWAFRQGLPILAEVLDEARELGRKDLTTHMNVNR